MVFAYKPESREFHAKQLQDDSYYFNGIPNFIVADIQFRALQLQFAFAFILVNISYTIVPSIMCMIPIAFSVIMAVTKANAPGVAQIITLLLSCIPIANPLTTIIVISHYRKICTQFFKAYIFPKIIVTSVSQNQSG
uniref:Uncharacterized protein n=1 Tax=Panagrolaimus sp. ES5 TaxID=591445 RepID=A0AC34FKT2_9BILA